MVLPSAQGANNSARRSPAETLERVLDDAAAPRKNGSHWGLVARLHPPSPRRTLATVGRLARLTGHHFVCRVVNRHKWERFETSMEEAYRCGRCGRRHYGKLNQAAWAPYAGAMPGADSAGADSTGAGATGASSWQTPERRRAAPRKIAYGSSPSRCRH
jgi:hypothetical protein